MTRERYTTIKYWQTESGDWKAKEPEADHEVVGRGESAPAAVANYAEFIDDTRPSSHRQEVPADD